MATHSATQATISTVWPKVQPGDTLKLDGAFTAWRPVNRAFSVPITIDASTARLTDFYAVGLDGVNIHGGEWSPGLQFKVGLRADRSKRIAIRGARLVGASPSAGDGMMLMSCHDVTAEDIEASTLTNAIGFKDVIGLNARRIKAHILGADGIDLYGVQDGLLEEVDIGDFRTVGGFHADAVQLASQPIDPKQPGRNLRTERVTIRNVRARGKGQGVTAFNHPDMGQQGFANITIEKCDLEMDAWNGIAMHDGVDCVIRDNVIRTAPGSALQCRIDLRRNTGLIRERNLVAGHVEPTGRVWAEIADPDYAVPVSPPAPITPETIEITLKPGQRLIVTGA